VCCKLETATLRGAVYSRRKNGTNFSQFSVQQQNLRKKRFSLSPDFLLSFLMP
jgi:hypothetical protein